MDVAISLALGICLSAACGFRVFAPLLALSVAAKTGYFTPAENLAWIASWGALTVFATAAIVEVAAYYIPWADNALDAVATPAALIAGTLASASVLGDFPPSLQWVLAAVAGAGSAGVVQAGTVVLRGTSSLSTGGLANPVIATLENILSVITVVLALAMPFIMLAIIVIVGTWLWRSFSRPKTSVSPAG